MKKKVLSMMALALTFTMVFGMSVSAAKSVSTTDPSVNTGVMEDFANKTEVSKVETADGESVDGYITVEPTTVDRYDEAVAQAASMDAVQDQVPSGHKVKIHSMFDLKSFNISEEALAKGIKVTIKVPGIKGNGKYMFLHLSEVRNLWEMIPATVNGDLSLSGIFKDFSPVAILEVVEESNAGSGSEGGSGSAGGSAGVESPKTGQESNFAMILTMTALCGMAVVCFKKANRI